MKNVTAVVCSWNAIRSIEKCLKSLTANGINIIVVDADSTDGSKEIAYQYANEVITDPKKGLAVARNLGIEKVQTKYVLNWGVDNILPEGQLKIMIDCLEHNKFGGVSAQTFVKSEKMNYLSGSLNLYKKARYFPGERDTIGTPTLFLTSLLKENQYDRKMSHSDDGDICTRLAKKNYKFAISNAFVYEYGCENLSTICQRWRNYGKSDSEIFSKYSQDWSLNRKVKSILYPLNNEFLLPLKKSKIHNKVKLLPFLALITFIRYIFWIKFSIFKSEFS